jgi:hypothetical protein
MSTDPIPGVDVVVEKIPPGNAQLIGFPGETKEDIEEAYDVLVNENSFTTSSKQKERFRTGLESSPKFSADSFDEQFINLSKTINNNAKTLAYVLNEVKGMTGVGGDTFPFTGDAIIEGTLTVNFTESLKFLSTTEFSEAIGSFFVNGNWINFDGVGDFIGVETIKENYSFKNGIVDGIFDAGLFSFPVEISGKIGYVTDGPLSGSVLANAILYVDQSDLGGDISYLNQFYSVFSFDGEKQSFAIQTSMDLNGANMTINKINNEGKAVGIDFSSDSTGIRIGNSLSDDTASVLTITNNDNVNIIDFLNDNILSDIILNHNYMDDMIASANVPVGGIYHNGGSLRIRLS